MHMSAFQGIDARCWKAMEPFTLFRDVREKPLIATTKFLDGNSPHVL